jgi:hypothetical protein
MDQAKTAKLAGEIKPSKATPIYAPTPATTINNKYRMAKRLGRVETEPKLDLAAIYTASASNSV